MVRKKEKEFDRINDWQMFLEKWRGCGTEEEVIGLLYVGTKVPPVNALIEAKDFGETLETRMRFYLQVAGYKSASVVITAQQIIVKQWLRKLGSVL